MSDHHDSHRMTFNKGWQQPIIVLAIIVLTALVGVGFGFKHMGYALTKPECACCADGKCEMDGKKGGHCDKCKDGACEKDGKGEHHNEHHEGGEHH